MQQHVIVQAQHPLVLLACRLRMAYATELGCSFPTGHCKDTAKLLQLGSHPDPCLQVADLLRVARRGLADQDAGRMGAPTQLPQQVTDSSDSWIILWSRQ